MIKVKKLSKEEIALRIVKHVSQPFAPRPIVRYVLQLEHGAQLVYNPTSCEVHFVTVRLKRIPFELRYTLDEFIALAVSFFNLDNEYFNYLDYV